MSWPRSLVLVRHAESEGNVRSPDERAAFDVATHAYALTERGRKQAEITGKWLRDNLDRGPVPLFDTHYVSYYTRSRETMKIMFPDVTPWEDARLAEAQRGIYQTLTKEQLVARFPEELQRREREGYYHHRPLGGESWPDVELRIHSFLGTLARDQDGQDVVIVCHGHWLILFQKLVHHFTIEEAIERYKNKTAPNASVTIYRGRNQRLVLDEENIVPWKDQL